MSGVMGQRILRREDSRFLLGKGQYVENMELPGTLHATFVRSPYAHARIVGIDTSAVSSVPDAQVFTASEVELPPFPPPPIPGINEQDGQAVPRERGRAVRGRHRRRGPHREPRRRHRRRRARDGRLRAPARRRRPRGGSLGKRAPVPRARDERLRQPSCRGARRGPVRGLRRRRVGTPREPAPRGLSARGTRVRRRVRRRRADDALAVDADAAPRPPCPGVVPRPRRRGSARRRSGRRGRVRRERPQRRDGDRPLARAQDRSPRAVDGEPQREHDRDAAGPRGGARVHDRRESRGRRAARTGFGSCRTRARIRGSARSFPASRR